jgi:hypothetical protein
MSLIVSRISDLISMTSDFKCVLEASWGGRQRVQLCEWDFTDLPVVVKQHVAKHVLMV